MYFVTQLTRTRKRTLTKLHIFKPQNFEPTHPTFCMKKHNTHVCISHITAENLVYIRKYKMERRDERARRKQMQTWLWYAFNLLMRFGGVLPNHGSHLIEECTIRSQRPISKTLNTAQINPLAYDTTCLADKVLGKKKDLRGSTGKNYNITYESLGNDMKAKWEKSTQTYQLWKTITANT